MRYFWLLVMSFSLWGQQNKVICIMSTPRSLSTVFLRTFENRDDFVAFNEPACALYVQSRDDDYAKDWFDELDFHTYDEMKKAILEARKDHNVIVKLGSFVPEPFMMEHDDFIQDPNVHFIFLTRDPYNIAKSMYGIYGKATDIMYRTLGTESLCKIYKKVIKLTKNHVQFIFTEDLLEKPEEVITLVQKKFNLPFSKKAFSWKAKGDSFDGEEWHDQKSKKYVHIWHGNALNSTHIRPTPKKIKPSVKDMFKYAKTKEDKEVLRKVYEYHLPYYHSLLKEKEKYEIFVKSNSHT